MQDESRLEKKSGDNVNKDEPNVVNCDVEIQVKNKIPRTPPTKAGHLSRKSNANVSKDYRPSRSHSVRNRNRSSSNSKSKRKREGNENVCGVCKKEFIKGKEDCVECDLCYRWFHGPICVDLSAKEIAAITLLGDKIAWYCPDCSIGASTLHKQTKLLNDAIGKLDTEVTLLKSQQSATVQSLTTANQNISKNFSDIQSNSARISKTKEDLVVLTTNQQVNTTKINALNTKVEAIEKNAKNDLNKLFEENIKDDKIAESIKKLVKEETAVMEANLMTKLETNLKLQVKEVIDKSEINPTPINTVEIKKAVDEKFTEVYNAEFPMLHPQKPPNQPNNDNINSRTVYPTRFTRAVQEEIAEREEILRRKNQLIIMNLKESKSEAEDRAKLKELFNLLKLNDEVIVTEAIRLGEKRRDNKHRFLRVTLENLETKRKILAKATTLRDVPEGSDYHKVFIKPNLTVKQNEISKNLREDLRVRRLEEPTKRFKITKGKIVEEPNNQQ